ncbi:dual specificity protein phosphatase 22-A-like isoform X3 [Melanerpes formicivorus]|uniref:dual specificity protein phosphatase 22-A-like isoform X3 n=1 Tax=Melanerpes formicivorus TaxID=211600 RepID=UPI00358EBABE
MKLAAAATLLDPFLLTETCQSSLQPVVKGLYLGNIRDSEDRDNLLKNGVTHILSVHNSAKPVLEDMTYLCISASDSSSQNLLQHFKECIKFIHECRLSGGGCLVHCTAPGSAVTMAGTHSRTRRSCSACWLDRSRGRRSSSWGAEIAPGTTPQLPPTLSPTTQVAPPAADG